MANLIDLIINAQNKASPAIKQVSGDLKTLEKSGTEANTSLSSLGAKAAGAFGLTLGIAGVVQLTQAISDLAIQAGKAQQLRASFDGLAVGVGQSSQAMLDAMKAASDGLVSDADLILSANKAMLLGVADTSEELSALLEVARSRGAAMGLSTTQAFNDIVTGLGRESALILDNLGITVDLEGVMQKYAATLGTTAAALDATQRKQALLNEVMAQSAGLAAPIETAATSWERASVAIENAKVALGELFGPVVAEVLSGVAYVADATADMFNGDVVKRQIDQLTGDLGLYRNALAETEEQIRQYRESVAMGMERDQAFITEEIQLRNQHRATIADLEAQLGSLQKSYDANAKSSAALNVEIQTAAQFYPSMADGVAMLAAQEDNAALSAAILADQANKVRARLAELAGQADTTGNALRMTFLGATQTLGAMGALAGMQDAQRELQLLRQEWQYMGLTADQVAFKEAEYLANTRQGIQNQADAIRDATRATEKMASGGVATAAKAYDDLASKISGVVSGMTSLSEIGGGPKQTGDAANENAKRMAAIANEGIIGQSWLEDFKNEVPQLYAEVMAATDPKAFATTWVQDFQAGLHPEALDREMIKGNIRRMILGEETMSTYVAEIAAELKTEGIWSPAAEAVVAGMTGGMSAANVGQQVGATTLASINTPAAVTEFQNAGESAFGSWKTGWDTAASTWHPYPPSTGGIPLESVPPAGGVLPSVNITPFGGATSQSNTTSNTSVSVTVNAGGNANPTAIGMATRSGVLDGLRASGAR